MATVYRKGDAGAPALAYSTAQATIANFTAFKVILIACLVTGYGGKPAAGWELIAEGSNHLVLRNATHSGYVCFSWRDSYGIVIHVAETFTGVTDNIMTGGGLKTGLAANNATPHRLGLTWLVHSSATSSWYVVADGKSFTFGGAGHSTNLSVDVNTYSMKPLHVGEDTQGNFLAVGGYTSTTDALAIQNTFQRSCMTVLKDPVTGLLVDSGAFSPAIPALFQIYAGWRFAEFVLLGEVTFSKVAWGRVGTPAAGFLRGIAAAHDLSSLLLSSAIASLGGAPTTNLSDIHNPIVQADGYLYLPGTAHVASSTFFVTDSPEFWE